MLAYGTQTQSKDTDKEFLNSPGPLHVPATLPEIPHHQPQARGSSPCLLGVSTHGHLFGEACPAFSSLKLPCYLLSQP